MSEKQNLGQSKHKKFKISTLLLVGVIIAALAVAGVVIAFTMYQSSSTPFGPTNVLPSPSPTPTTTPTPSPFNPILSTNYNLPTTTVGTPIGFTVTLTNDGSSSTINNLVYFTITESGTAIASDVTLQYYDGNTYQTIPLTANGNTLSGTFGPANGFPVVAGYDQTTQMQITYNVVGTFSGTATVGTI